MYFIFQLFRTTSVNNNFCFLIYALNIQDYLENWILWKIKAFKKFWKMRYLIFFEKLFNFMLESYQMKEVLINQTLKKDFVLNFRIVWLYVFFHPVCKYSLNDILRCHHTPVNGYKIKHSCMHFTYRYNF